MINLLPCLEWVRSRLILIDLRLEYSKVRAELEVQFPMLRTTRDVIPSSITFSCRTFNPCSCKKEICILSTLCKSKVTLTSMATILFSRMKLKPVVRLRGSTISLKPLVSKKLRKENERYIPAATFAIYSKRAFSPLILNFEGKL